MQYLSYSSPSPTLNLAMEEVLLEPMVKQANAPAIFRAWDNQKKCIVIGRGEKIDQQVHIDHTIKDIIPIYRRISGGGTVLHGPQNFNLSFFLPYSHDPALSNLKESYRIILSWVQEALNNSHKLKVTINGSCDLVIGNKKFSGTAQARKRHGLLHHMTILLKADYEGMQQYLTEPNKRPDYRENRTHRDFVIGLQDHLPEFNLEVFIDSLKSILKTQRDFELPSSLLEKAEELAKNKYSQEFWNRDGRLS
jgi:lipoate-protein ligase A